MTGIRFLISFCTGLVLGPVAASSPTVEQCAACHAMAGTSGELSIPVIGGMSSFYLEYALEAYQRDERSCPDSRLPDGGMTSMCKLAKSLSRDDIRQVAAHYSAQTFVGPEQTTDPRLVQRGAALHQQHCIKCHSDNGGNSQDDAGFLAGQWKEYLQFAMEDIRRGTRPTIKKMQQKLAALSPEDIEALAHFYAAQP